MVSHHFNLHFSDGNSGAPLHMFICNLCISFSEVSLKELAYFLIKLFVFLLLNFKSSLSILINSPLSNMSVANIFSLSIAF